MSRRIVLRPRPLLVALPLAAAGCASPAARQIQPVVLTRVAPPDEAPEVAPPIVPAAIETTPAALPEALPELSCSMGNTKAPTYVCDGDEGGQV